MFHNASYRPTPSPAPSGAVARHLLFTSCSSRGYPSRFVRRLFLIDGDIFRIDFSGDERERERIVRFFFREIGIVIDFVFFFFFFEGRVGGKE